MPPGKPLPGSSEDWLRHAQSDLLLAGIPLPQGVLYNELCFHAQQAVEKSIKAVLIYHNVEFRKSHALDYLFSLLPQEVPLPCRAKEAVGLTNYAVMLRYPGDYEDVEAAEYQETLLIAQELYAWAERSIVNDEESDENLGQGTEKIGGIP